MPLLSPSFFLEDDVVALSQKLLGLHIYTQIDGVITGGQIIETEAYRGPDDRASHAYLNRRTKRTEVMFQKGGICYVYLCYGIHHLLNVVTNQAGIPHAILLRSLIPQTGIATMLERRGKTKEDKNLTSGPGSLASALGVDLSFNGFSFASDTIWIEKKEKAPSKHRIKAAPRIGVDYAGPDAKLPWRFTLT